jgi:hypothetical protein
MQKPFLFRKHILRHTILLVASIVLMLLSVQSAFAASIPAPQKTHQQESTIEWLDTSGHVIKIWKGPEAAAVKIRQHEESIRSKALLQKLQKDKQKQSVVPNIDRIYNCTLPNSFFTLRNEGLVCFADAGETSISVYDVYEVNSGNNHGYVGYCLTPWTNCYYPFIGFNTTLYPASGHTWAIWDIDILPASQPY